MNFRPRPMACLSQVAVRRRASAKRTMKRRPDSATVLALKRRPLSHLRGRGILERHYLRQENIAVEPLPISSDGI